MVLDQTRFVIYQLFRYLLMHLLENPRISFIGDNIWILHIFEQRLVFHYFISRNQVISNEVVALWVEIGRLL
jgi:hypothetical protein